MSGSVRDKGTPGPAERLVYVMPEQALSGTADDEISLRDLWRILWRGKWIVIAVTAFFAVGAVIYALAHTHWYRAEVLLAPTDSKSAPTLGGQLGGLAALAGVSVNGARSAEPLAVLGSRDFATEFIEEFGLLQVFFDDEWDDTEGKWREPNPAKWPDTRDAVKYFHENILSVREDPQSRLVTLAIEWTDPDIAANWATAVTHRLNARLRERALLEAESNVAFLRAELSQTNLLTLQQSIGRLLESELQKLMLARGSEEFAFRIIDAAVPPKRPVRPKRFLIALIGTVLGCLLGIISVFALHATRRSDEAEWRS